MMNDNLVGEDTVNLVIGVNGGCVFAALFFFIFVVFCTCFVRAGCFGASAAVLSDFEKMSPLMAHDG